MIRKIITELYVDLYGDTKFYAVSAKQYDKASRQIHITLLENNKIYELQNDAIVIINVKKPDGKFVYNQCEKNGNVIIVEMTNQMLAAAGTAIADINVKTSDGSQLLSSASFSIEIEKSMRNELAIISSNEMNLIDDKLKLIAAAEQIRVIAENERIEAENARIKLKEDIERAENARIKQENERQRDTAKTIANANEVIANANEATMHATNVTDRAEKVLYNQALLEQTVNQVTDMKQSVSKDKDTVISVKNEVIEESQTIKATIEKASVEAAKELLDAIQAVADEIKEQYGTLTVTADGGTPASIDYLTIDGGTPFTIDSLKLDAGNPYSI